MNKLFKEILDIQSYTHKTEKMTNYIVQKCIEIGCNVYMDEGNIYATKGDAETYPCIVAHTDTVHEIIKGYKVIMDDNIAMAYNIIKNAPTGIGGDDKVGIYIALQCLSDMNICKAVFFRDEEIGCEGSSFADMLFFNDCRFVLQCDRKGNNDFVNKIMGVELYSKQFSKAISPILKKYGYKETIGGMTDVYQLKDDGLSISVANMSCGYYNPHTSNEMINFADVKKCLNMVKDIVRIKNTFKHISTKKTYYSNNYTYKPVSKYNLDIDYKDMVKIYDHCWDCREFIPKNEMADYGLCKDCSTSHVPF